MDQFIQDSGAWNLQHPEEANKLRSERLAEGEPEVEAPAETVAEAVNQVEGEQPEAAKPPEGQPPVAATPAKVEEWTSKSPELKAAFEKNPELRTEIMEMARGLEAAKPVLDIVSTAEEAQFAVENANRLVSLQTNWMLSANDPEMVEPAWEQTLEFFKERDDKGAEVKDAQGNPKLAPDFKPFVHRAASTAMQDFAASAQQQIAAIEARMAGVYPNEEAREADEEALRDAKYEKLAFDFVMERLKAPTDPSQKLPTLPANATREQIEFQKKLEEQQRELDAKQGKQSTETRKAASKAVDKDVQQAYEQGLNSYIETTISQMRERGEYIPDFVLQDKWINPATGQETKVSAFGARLYLALNAKINSNPMHVAKLAQLQAMGAPGKEARIAEVNRLRGIYLPKLFENEVKRIHDDMRKMSGKKPATSASPARIEPQSAGTVVPSAMNDGQLRSWAEGEAKKDASFGAMSAADKEATIMALYAQKKYGG